MTALTILVSGAIWLLAYSLFGPPQSAEPEKLRAVK